MRRHTLRLVSVGYFSGLVMMTGLSCAARTRSDTVVINGSTPRAGLSAAPVHDGRASADLRPVDSTPQRYLSHIALLASDELGGRGTGSDGIDLAAGYIAGQFAAAGLEPGGPGGTYFQEFKLDTSAKLLDTTKLSVAGADAEPALNDDFVPFSFSTQGDFSGDAVFVGYGITRPDKDYDDYAGIDVTGRVALMLRREPKGWSADGSSDHAHFATKVKLAKEHGAAAVVIVNQDPGEDGIDGLMRFRASEESHGLPALHVKRKLADKLLAACGLPALKELQTQLDMEGKSASAALSDVRLSGTVAFETEQLTGRNVIGVLPGQGPHQHEYVVIGGHYDHLGTRGRRIYNGADDNASGSAGVIEMAKALSRTPYRDRSVLCMTFTGEEIGLRGSAHYVAHPTVKLDSIVAMINMDMIGRLSDEEANMLAIQGLGTGSVFKEIVERRSKELGIPRFLPDQSALGPSDHASFYGGGVPSLFFFTGVHDDYHQPGDDTDKINADGAVRILKLVYAIALDLINLADSPIYAEVAAPANIFRGGDARPGGGRVTMGVLPDREDTSDAPGMRVAAVLRGGGAERAGMKTGDRILRVDGLTINDLSDYREATRDKKPGDTIDVTVQRGAKELTLHVELSGRGG